MATSVYFTKQIITNEAFMEKLQQTPGNQSGTMNVGVGNDDNPILNFGDFNVSLYIQRGGQTYNTITMIGQVNNQFNLVIPAILYDSPNLPLNIPQVSLSNVIFAYNDFDGDGDMDLAVKAMGMKGALLFTQEQEINPELRP